MGLCSNGSKMASNRLPAFFLCRKGVLNLEVMVSMKSSSQGMHKWISFLVPGSYQQVRGSKDLHQRRAPKSFGGTAAIRSVTFRKPLELTNGAALPSAVFSCAGGSVWWEKRREPLCGRDSAKSQTPSLGRCLRHFTLLPTVNQGFISCAQEFTKK